MAYVLLQVSVGRVLCLFSLVIMTKNVAGKHNITFYSFLHIIIIAYEQLQETNKET